MLNETAISRKTVPGNRNNTQSLQSTFFFPQSTEATRYLRFSVEIEKALYPHTSEGLYSNILLEKEHIFLVITGNNF